MPNFGWHYPPGVTTLPGEELADYIKCPACGDVYETHDELDPEYQGPRECDCGYEFTEEDYQ